MHDNGPTAGGVATPSPPQANLDPWHPTAIDDAARIARSVILATSARSAYARDTTPG
jgi:hypothetical protein